MTGKDGGGCRRGTGGLRGMAGGAGGGLAGPGKMVGGAGDLTLSNNAPGTFGAAALAPVVVALPCLERLELGASRVWEAAGLWGVEAWLDGIRRVGGPVRPL